MDARAFWDWVASEVEQRATRAGIDFYSVEDFDCEGRVVVYANAGDTYARTICAIVDGRNVTFEAISWGDLVEKLELQSKEAE